MWKVMWRESSECSLRSLWGRKEKKRASIIYSTFKDNMTKIFKDIISPSTVKPHYLTGRFCFYPSGFDWKMVPEVRPCLFDNVHPAGNDGDKRWGHYPCPSISSNHERTGSETWHKPISYHTIHPAKILWGKMWDFLQKWKTKLMVGLI